MLRVLIISSFLFGLGTLLTMFLYSFLRRVRRSRVWTMVVMFGAIGLVIAGIFSAVALAGKNDSAAEHLLWPTSIVLMAGELDDTLPTKLLVFGMATLGNIGLYGFIGLVVGSVWARVGTKTLSSSGEQ